MGVPSASQIQSWSDKIAARIQSDLNGEVAGYSPATINDLWDLVDLSTDPDVLGALGTASLGLDRRTLPENYATLIPYLCSATDYGNFVQALNTLVGGPSSPYASLAAYLSGVGASVHPLFSELVRARLGESVFNLNNVPVGVFAPQYACRFGDHVYAGADGALADVTAAAASATAADLTIFDANNKCVYIGCRHKFTMVCLALSTLANVSVAFTAQYWNGNAWVAVSGLVDNSAGLTKNDTIEFTNPNDWQRCHKDAGGTEFASLEGLYYLRLQRTTVTVATPPVGTCITLNPVPTLAANGSSHMGTPQPALAIARVPAPGVIAVSVKVNPDILRYVAPALRLRALTNFGANVTPTVSYTNQSGVNVTQAQTAWVAPAALDTKVVALNGGDTGAAAILSTGWAVVAANPGIFAVEVVPLRTPAV